MVQYLIFISDFSTIVSSVLLGIILAVIFMIFVLKSNKWKPKFFFFNRKKEETNRLSSETPEDENTTTITPAIEKVLTKTSTVTKGIGLWEEKLNRLELEKNNLLQLKEEEINRLKEENGKYKNAEFKSPVQYYFYSEVMVTAGPRKKEGRDIDYGEDTCGVVHSKDKILFWLLDGTSDQDVEFFQPDNFQVEMFSSRLMVQSIAKLLPEIFATNDTLDAKSITKKAISKLVEEWEKRFTPFKAKIEVRKNLKCATTLIVGTLNKSGKLDAYVIGDSKLLFFNSDKNFIESSSSSETNQDFIAEVIDGDLSLFTGVNEAGKRERGEVGKGKTYTANNVSSIICHSDGISERRSTLIQKISAQGFVELRSALHKIPVNSKDDKSMLIIELKNS